MNTPMKVAVVTLISLVGAACDRNDGDVTSTGRPTGNTTSSTTTTTPSRTTTTTPAVDNTARNKVDRDSNLKTPMDQSENSSDIKITAEIRRAIIDDKAMSTNAQNCKIMTDKGAVTLRGVVESQAEKDAIEAKARTVAGASSVTNLLEIKTK